MARAKGDVFESKVREQDWNTIGQALKSGDLAGAQQALRAATEHLPSTAALPDASCASANLGIGKGTVLFKSRVPAAPFISNCRRLIDSATPMCSGSVRILLPATSRMLCRTTKLSRLSAKAARFRLEAHSITTNVSRT